MPKLKDLSGFRFGKWSVIEWACKKQAEQHWKCVCDCGTVKVVNGTSLKKGTSRSCGCASKDWCYKHGMEGTSIYNIWAGMIQRCHNERAREFKYYGARGIKVCDRWRLSFQAFYEDMGDRPSGLSIDRINNDGDYEPANCRWASKKQQIRNRSVTKMHDGVSVAELAENAGVSVRLVRARLNRGWEMEKALSNLRFRRGGHIA